MFLLLLAPVVAIVYPDWMSESQYTADAGAYPWSFPFPEKGECTATMITQQHAITAAHCFDGMDSSDISSSTIRLHNGQTARVSKTYLNPCFNKNGDEHNAADIAIIKLDKPLDIQPVRMYNVQEQGPESSKQFFFLGYGDKGKISDGEPRQGSNPHFQRGSNVFLGVRGNANVLEYNFCSESKKIKYQGLAWSGDSGGPAFIIENGQGYLAGVNSGCIGDFGSTDQFARLGSPVAQQWIWDTINNDKVANANCQAFGSSDNDRVSEGCPAVSRDQDAANSRPMPATCPPNNPDCNNPEAQKKAAPVIDVQETPSNNEKSKDEKIPAPVDDSQSRNKHDILSDDQHDVAPDNQHDEWSNQHDDKWFDHHNASYYGDEEDFNDYDDHNNVWGHHNWDDYYGDWEDHFYV
jgi:hypothetical protein